MKYENFLWSISSFYNLIIIDWQILNKVEKLIYQSWVRNPLDKFQCKMQGLCPTVTSIDKFLCKMQGLCPTVTSTENWIGQNVPISLAMYLGSWAELFSL